VPTSADEIEAGDTIPAGSKIADAGPGDGHSLIAGLILRAQEPSDWLGIAALTELPKVRWGTLRLPFTSQAQRRKWTESVADDRTAIVAVLEGSIVGCAEIRHGKGHRRHAGGVGMSVHDDFSWSRHRLGPDGGAD
jgi:hypothetical protein